jgi:two-component system sensor histidine kinase BaeS
MRSLALKLTLAFLIVGVVGVALVALFVGQRTQQEFDQFVLSRFQLDLVNELADYYQTTGSWEGINAILVSSQSGRMGHRGVFPAPVALLDDDGTVVYGGRRYQRGQRLTESSQQPGVPIEVGGTTVGWLLFDSFGAPSPPMPESPESDFLGRVKQAILFGAIGATAVALLIGVLLARTISRPVRELTAATQMVTQGDLGHQVPVRTSDELGELANSFNRMSAQLSHSNLLRRQMTADIAHELRTPLSVILGYTEALTDGKLQAAPETFGVLHEEAQHLNRLVDDLRTLSLADAGELPLTRRPVEPQPLLERTAAAYAERARQKGVAVEVDAEPGLPEVAVDPDRMIQVFSNLVSNALRYTKQGGRITMKARSASDALILEVQDDGAGIPAEDLPHVFERFYRGDKSRHEHGPSGLGLAIAKSMVEAHGGTISVQSMPGAGTIFAVQLPLAGTEGKAVGV